MSKIFGDYQQNGYVVPDLDAAIEKWAALGVGPFYRIDALPVVNFTYLGSTEPPALDVALGNFGDVQVELIQVTDSETPSPYRDFATAHTGGGLHHVSVWSDDFDADLARWAAQGLSPDCTGEVSGFARFCYFSGASTDGTTIEVADTGASPVMRQVAGLIREAARTWDGTRATRSPEELYALLGS
ncbi:hypothetical protein OPAG_06857 [Rhodococcus opacus PD630]|uniref:VOC family protein n=1 Tax=Rhodococcus opacus TaxID=37919 RepID=UPI00029CBAEB|nr:VOC family protein [Rhodococcus opacus]AHK36060.1 hypothetical protein Pd630_LPD16101 [Rhodococcus opacus PD630]EHI43576.1 hypothetical protein OPAG_06857 [Rhodococcus opacus PD630]UDH01291.1 VOC family protein [Rhodococcus opacus PD630]